MALNLFYSNTFRGAFDSLCKRLKGNLNREQSNIVIVPDRFSLTIEKAILDKLGISGSMNVEVVSFSRLAALLLGNRIHKCLSPESAVMLLSKVIRENKDALQCYNGVKDISSFARDMFAAISEIRNNNISVEMLRIAQQKVKNKGIDKKTSDIILLYDKYLDELTLKYNDSTTRLEKLIEEIPLNDKIGNSHIYITDFYSFKNTEYKIIEALLNNAISVNVALISNNTNSLNRRIYPYYKLKTLADKMHCEIIESFNQYNLNSVNKVIEDRLFAYEVVREFESYGKVRLLSANDIESELIAIARNIRALIRSGRRYLDIAIVCGDIETYTPYIESIFKRFNIPIFIDRKEILANHPLIRYIFSIYDFINDDYQINYAYEIIKNPFSKISAEDSDIFENYCIKYGIKGKKLLNKFILGKAEEIIVAECVRARLISLVNVFDKNSIHQVSKYLEQTEELFRKSDSDKVMSHLAKIQVDLGDKALAEVTRQIPVKLSEMFSEITEILGNQEISFEEFVILIKTSLSSAKISMIPQYIDCVFVGEPLESRYALIKDLFVIGANDNVMPISHKDKGIITAFECNEWQLELFPSAKQSSCLDKFYLHQLLIKPEQSLTVSYCSRSNNGEFCNPSTIIKQLEMMFNLNIISVSDLYVDRYDLEDEERARLYGEKFSTYDNALQEIVGALRDIKEAKAIDNKLLPYDAVYQLLNEDKKNHILEINNLHMDNKPFINDGEILFFKKKSSTSVSQLECYFKCPFMHYAQYGIRAKEREEASVEANIRGEIIHLALELFIKGIMAKSSTFIINDKSRDNLIDSIIDIIINMPEYQPMLDKYIVEMLSDSIRRTCIYVLNIINKSHFKPYLVEAVFGENKQFPCIPISYDDNKAVNLNGKIDRVDIFNDQIIVVDYKTGNINELRDELYYGTKIQLFVYLKALSGNGLRPVGALYMQLKDDFKKSKEIQYAYYGKVIKDSINEFDPSINEDGSKLIMAKLKGDDIEGKGVIENELLNNMINYSIELAARASIEIANGYIEAKVYNDTCTYCSYIDICHARMKSPNYRKCSARSKELFEIGVKNV